MRRCLLIFILVIIFSFTVFAKNDRMLKEEWDNFLITTDLKYSAKKGEINFDLSYEKIDKINYMGIDRYQYIDIYHPIEAKDHLFSYKTISGLYSYNNNIELDGYAKKVTLCFDNENSSDVQFGGRIKAHLFDQDSILVAGSVFFYYYGDESNSYGSYLYTDKEINNKLTLHNNILLFKFNLFSDYWLKKCIYNGLTYRFNDQNVLKAYLYTDLDLMTPSIHLMYRNDFNDQVSFLSKLDKMPNFKNVSFKNLVEIDLMSDLIITGYYDFNSKYEDFLGIDLRKEFNHLILIGGSEHNTTTNKNTLYATLLYDLREDLEMEINLRCKETSTYLKAGLSYLL